MLALATGWKPPELRSLPEQFRRACHWALYTKTLVPEGIPDVSASLDMSASDRAAAMKQRVHIAELRRLLFPEDD